MTSSSELNYLTRSNFELVIIRLIWTRSKTQKISILINMMQKTKKVKTKIQKKKRLVVKIAKNIKLPFLIIKNKLKCFAKI